MLGRRLFVVAALGLILIVLTATFVWAQDIPAWGEQLNNGASLSLSPSSPSVQDVDVFTMDIIADTGTGTADTVDAYIDFDPAYLEVVDASGTPATSIELNTGLFSSATFNSVDNATGQINFSASKYDSPYLAGSFTAATIRFKAKAAVASTNIAFVQTGARWSDLYRFGDSLNPTIIDGTVTIMMSCPDFENPPVVDVGDLNHLAALWHQPPELYDCDGDGYITVVDLECVAKQLGNTCSNGTSP